jgi:signal transduction histidine kinase
VSRRILTTIVGIATLAVVCFGIPLALSVQRALKDDAISTLEREAARAAIEAPRNASLADPIELPKPIEDGVRLAVYNATGTKVAGTGPDAADDATASALGGQLASSASGSELIVGWPLTANEVTYGAVRAALPEDTFTSKVHHAWALMVLLGALVIAAAALVAWRQSRRLAQPVAALTAAVERLGAGDFDVAVAPSGVAELDHAGATLQTTATRLGGVLEREREFSANVSHQLRTPLTGLRLTLELGASGDGHPQAAMEEALRSVDRLETTVDELLSLARDARPVSVVDIAGLIDEETSTWHGRLAAAGRPLRTTVAEDLPRVAASATAVREILDVLLSNALEHGDGVVTLDAAATPGGVVIEVADEGEGIAGDPEAVFARRVGRGTGIGLSLARSLAEADGGRLALRHAGRAPRFRLLLPAADSPG